VRLLGSRRAIAGLVREDIDKSLELERQDGGRRAPKLPAPTDHLDGDPERLEDIRNVGKTGSSSRSKPTTTNAYVDSVVITCPIWLTASLPRPLTPSIGGQRGARFGPRGRAL